MMKQTTNPRSRSVLAGIFLSPAEPRLRAGWRLLIQTILLFLLAFCFGLLILVPYSLLVGLNLSGFPYLLVSEIIEVFAITLSVFIARRLLDRRSLASLGFKIEWRALHDLMAGVLITFLMMGLVYLLMWALGWIRFRGFAWQEEEPLAVLGNTLLMIFAFLLVAWNEELLSRGYQLQTITSGINSFWGVLLSSALFGILHLINPGASWISTLGIFLAGLFLAFAYLRTGQLWLSIGLHFGWNFFEGTIFGFPVSGLNLFSITRITVDGPRLWTGGTFGPEAGLILLPGLVWGALLVYLYSRIRLRLSPPS